MTWLWIVLLAVVLIGVLLYLSTTAGRLDRMRLAGPRPWGPNARGGDEDLRLLWINRRD